MTIRSLLIGMSVCLLIACSGLPGEQAAPESQIGGLTPDSVTTGFFTDLGRALKDPALSNATTRSRWVDQLAAYFAPDERDAQRETLDNTLAGFASDRAKLAADETLTIEITFDSPRIISNDGQRALVVLPNASIFMQISRITDRGPVPYYEQPISLDRVIGRADGAVPTVKIGNYWFLTEG